MPPSTSTTNSTTAPAKTPSSATRPHQRTVDRPEGSGQCSLPTLAGGDAPAALSARATEVAAMGGMVVFRLASGADSSGPGQFGHERVLGAARTSVPLTWTGRELEGAT